jgi:non-heme chloroperoxidase
MPQLSIGTENGSPVELHYTDQGSAPPYFIYKAGRITGGPGRSRSPRWSTPATGS